MHRRNRPRRPQSPGRREVYAASLLAIEVDTPAEKAYMQKLARDLKLDAPIVSQIHTTLGLA